MPYLTGVNSGSPHDVLYWRWLGQFAIRKGAWKYLASGDRQYLFNLANDAGEKHNLLSQNIELATAMRSQMERWSQGLMPPGLVPSEMTRAGEGYFGLLSRWQERTECLPKKH